jgi:hypothetical protein
MATKTPLGLTRLAPGEPISADDFGIQDANPALVDYFIRLLLHHRHDEHAALTDPATQPTVTVDDTGGQIPSDTQISVGYTWIDTDGGETLLAEPVTVGTAAGLTTPEMLPTLTLDTTAGALLSNIYSYGVTLTDGNGGETAMSPMATITVPAGSSNNTIEISGLTSLVDSVPGATGWRLWRTVGGDQIGLIASGDEATDGYTDDGTGNVDCNVAPPTTTTNTRATSLLHVTVPGPAPAGAVEFRVYGSLDGSFGAPAILGTYPVAELDIAHDYTELAFTDGAPPVVATTQPGLDKITADELAGGGGGGGGGLFAYPADWDVGSLDVSSSWSTTRAGSHVAVGVRPDASEVRFLYDGNGLFDWGVGVVNLGYYAYTTGVQKIVGMFAADAPGMREGTSTVKFQLPLLDADLSPAVYAFIGHQFGPRIYASAYVQARGGRHGHAHRRVLRRRCYSEQRGGCRRRCDRLLAARHPRRHAGRR